MPNHEGSYNGWTNWETWNAHLWMTSYESTYNYVMSRCRVIDFDAESMKKLVAELFPYGTPDMKGADDLDKIDYEELAAAFNEE